MSFKPAWDELSIQPAASVMPFRTKATVVVVVVVVVVVDCLFVGGGLGAVSLGWALSGLKLFVSRLHRFQAGSFRRYDPVES